LKKILFLLSFFFGVLSLFVFFMVINKSVRKPEVLFITNYAPLTDGMEKAIDDINSIEKKFKLLWFNLDFKKINDPIYITKKRKELKNLIKEHKEKLVMIKAGSNSKTFAAIADILPENIPLLAASASVSVLRKYNGSVVFSTASLPVWTRSASMYKIIKLLSLQKIIAVKLNDKPQPYSKVVLEGVTSYYGVDAESVRLKDLNETYLLQHKRDLFMLYIDSSSKARKMYEKISSFGVKGLNFFSVYSTSLATKGENRLFSDSSSISKYKNVYFYPYLGQKVLNLCSYDVKCVSDYDNVWKVYYNSLLMIKPIEEKNINKIRKKIYNKLKSYEKNYYIEPMTQYVRKFEKRRIGDLVIYFNSAYRDVVDRYLFLYNKNKNLYEYQIPQNDIRNKEVPIIPVVYITTYVNNIDVLNLNASKAKVFLVVKLKSKKNVDLGKDITFNVDTDYADSLNINLVKSEKKDGFYLKTYFVDYVVEAYNDLYYFPFDKIVLNIEYVIKNFDKNPLILQTIDIDKSITSKVSSDWDVLKFYPSYYQKFFYSDVKPFKIYRQFFTIILKRNNQAEVLIKYFLPALMVLLIISFIAYVIMKKRMEEKVEIMIDGLLALISIYFIYSLLVSFKRFILMDMVFFVMFFIVMVYIVSIVVKRYYLKR